MGHRPCERRHGAEQWPWHEKADGQPTVGAAVSSAWRGEPMPYHDEGNATALSIGQGGVGRQATEQSTGGHRGSALPSQSEGESEPRVERDEEGAMVPLQFDSRAWGLLGEKQRRRGCALGHGSHVLTTRRPLKRFVEHVACVGVAKVGGNFGPLPSKIRRWATKDVCSPPDALQL